MRHALLLYLTMFSLSVEALSPSQVFEMVKNSVFVVRSLDATGKSIAQGSGVFMPSGKIGTNCHVVKNGLSFQVGSDKQFVLATVWGSDEEKDICLLEAVGLSGEPVNLGQASHLRVGDAVYAVGAPRGLELSLSDGIVSQLRGGPPPLIQTTAAISPGSSGGGLFDGEGLLVGFTSLHVKGGQSLNFALPVEWVEAIQPGRKAAQGRSELGWEERNSSLTIAGNWTGARDWCEQWTQAQPKNGNAWSQLGSAYLMLEDYTKAAQAYRQAVRIDPNDGYTWYVLGSAYIRLKRYTEAIAAYKEVVRIDSKSAGAWNRIGLIFDILKQYADAVNAYRQAIRIDPNNADAWESLGSMYMAQDRYVDAIPAFLEAVRIDPKNARTWYSIGLTYVMSGNRSAASVAVSQLRSIDPAEADKLARLVNGANQENRGAEDGWVVVGSDASDATYANPSSIRRKGVMVTMWDIVDFKKAKSIDRSVRPYKSTMSQSEYDCQNERLRPLSSSLRSNNMAKGDVVFSNDESGEWIALPPDSRGKRLWLVACGEPSEK